MGASGISVWQLLIVLLIVILIFGTKRMKNIGGDLGGAIKSFRKGMTEADKAGMSFLKLSKNSQTHLLKMPQKSQPTPKTKTTLRPPCLMLVFGRCCFCWPLG